MILVTGASGQLGGLVARKLIDRGQPVRLLSRDPSRLTDFPEAEVAAGAYEDPAALDRACAGCDAAFVVSGHTEPMIRAKSHGNVFQAAARAGAQYIVYTSFQSAGPASQFPYGRDHYQSEIYLGETGVPHLALRNSLYLDMIPELFNPEGVILGPAGAGRVAWASREDIAETAAAALSEPGKFQGALPLTGPEALTLGETAELLVELTGRDLRYQDETMAAGRIWRSKFDVPDWEVDVWLGSYAAIAAGEMEALSDTVERITGHKPMSIREFEARFPGRLAAALPAG